MTEALVGLGANLAPKVGESSVIEGETESPYAHIRWYSAAIIHYTGNGLWRVGIIPHKQHNKWEWFDDLSMEDIGKLFADTKFRRCPTDELEERIGSNQA